MASRPAGFRQSDPDILAIFGGKTDDGSMLDDESLISLETTQKEGLKQD
jgi:hypothetical protein